MTENGFVISNRRLEELVVSIFKVGKEDILEERWKVYPKCRYLSKDIPNPIRLVSIIVADVTFFKVAVHELLLTQL